MIGALINNGTIALLGFVLILIAPTLHSDSGRLRRQRDRVAVIGYLLVIPLQGVAAAGAQHRLIQPGLVLYRLAAGWLQG